MSKIKDLVASQKEVQDEKFFAIADFMSQAGELIQRSVKNSVAK